ncbi:hypothetical protein [Streptomyces sp. NPDC059874]|uniref:hypothetical protein n=1 Tax=Streptomyces sp. NPDC059874 TaxID=3346983 RepID=UPI003647887C
MAELVKICDQAGRARGSGFVADDRGTVVTSHEAVAGLTRVLLHGPDGRTCLSTDITLLPGAALALVQAHGLGARPLPVAMRDPIPQGAYVRVPARGWRQARVLALHALVVELAIGTDGRDALRQGGEACGGPVLDAETGAVLAVLGGGFAVALRAAAKADPGGPLAELLDRNAATVPAYGADLNLAGALELTGTTLGAADDPEPAPIDRPAIAAELDAFTAGNSLVLALVGSPGTGRTTALAALAARRSRGSSPAPTLWLRGADLHAQDTSLADAATRALTTTARILATPDRPSRGRVCAGASPQGVEHHHPRPSDPWKGSTPEETPRHAPGAGGTPSPPPERRSPAAPDPGGTCQVPPERRSPPAPDLGGTSSTPPERCSPAAPGAGGTCQVPPERRSPPAPDLGGTPSTPPGPPQANGIADAVARAAAAAGRGLVVVLDAPEEMPPQLAHRPGPWTEATVAWLRGAGARLVVAARPEYWEAAGALYPPEVLHTPARPARRLPPALPLGDLAPAEAETARARLGIPADAVQEADARHPLTLRLLAGIRAAGVTAGRPGRDEVFATHLDLVALRVAVRIAAAAGGVHGPGVRRLAARVAGRVHEAARRCLGPGQGQLDRAAFEELFPWRTGWASAVITEGLLVPAGPGYRFAHEELSDWLQAGHLDVPAALRALVHQPTGQGLPVPRHRIGPVLEALRRLPPDRLRTELTHLVEALNTMTERAAPPGPGVGGLRRSQGGEGVPPGSEAGGLRRSGGVEGVPPGPVARRGVSSGAERFQGSEGRAVVAFGALRGRPGTPPSPSEPAGVPSGPGRSPGPVGPAGDAAPAEPATLIGPAGPGTLTGSAGSAGPAGPGTLTGSAGQGGVAGLASRGEAGWWAGRLLRESLLRAPDARPHLPVLHALAEHVARAGPGEFGGWFWNRLRLPEPERLDLLRRLLPADPAEAVPGDRYLDAAARRPPATRKPSSHCSAPGSATAAGCAAAPAPPSPAPPRPCCTPTAGSPWTTSPSSSSPPGTPAPTSCSPHSPRRSPPPCAGPWTAGPTTNAPGGASRRPRTGSPPPPTCAPPPTASCCATPPRRCSPAPPTPPCTPALSPRCSATRRRAAVICRTPWPASATPSTAPGCPPRRWSRRCPCCPIRTRCSTPCGPGPTARWCGPWPR